MSRTITTYFNPHIFNVITNEINFHIISGIINVKLKQQKPKTIYLTHRKNGTFKKTNLTVLTSIRKFWTLGHIGFTTDLFIETFGNEYIFITGKDIIKFEMSEKYRPGTIFLCEEEDMYGCNKYGKRYIAQNDMHRFIFDCYPRLNFHYDERDILTLDTDDIDFCYRNDLHNYLDQIYSEIENAI